MLTADEQTTLDAYLKELGKARAAVAAAAAAAGRRRRRPVAPGQAAVPAAARATTVCERACGSDGPSAGEPAGPDQIGPSVDTRARARWLLHEAREKLIQGKLRRGPAQGGRGRAP